MEIRLGECKKCGKCCYTCIHLNKNNTCNCYNNRPDFCIKDFPRTKKDLYNWNLLNECGFYFVEIKI